MSTARDLHQVRLHIVAAIKRHGSDVDLASALRVVDEALEQFTPVDASVQTEIRKQSERAMAAVRVSNPAKDEP